MSLLVKNIFGELVWIQIIAALLLVACDFYSFWILAIPALRNDGLA
jgi:hypothetical protein